MFLFLFLFSFVSFVLVLRQWYNNINFLDTKLFRKIFFRFIFFRGLFSKRIITRVHDFNSLNINYL